MHPSNTNIIKRFGGNAKISDISVGDVLNVDGSLLSSSDSLNINATNIRDLNLEKEDGNFSGKGQALETLDKFF